MESSQHICQECSRVSEATCCQTEWGVTVSLPEAAEIRAATGRPLMEWAHIEKLDDELVAELSSDPFPFLFIGQRRLLQLKQFKHDDSCIFLRDGEGCTVFNSRPAICKFYPFWYDQSNRLVWPELDGDVEDDECLVVRRHCQPSQNRPRKQAMAELRMSTAYAEKSAAVHRSQLSEHKRLIEELLVTTPPRLVTIEQLDEIASRIPVLVPLPSTLEV